MEPKILFLDLDGTLLNSHREISPGNRAALQKALSAGHRVVINTGRPLHSAILQNERLGLTQDGCYVISFNGGVIFDAYRNEVIYSQCLPLETAIAVTRLCNEKNVHVQTYDREKVLVEPRWDDTQIRNYCNRILMEYRVVPDFATGLLEAPPKVLAVSETDRSALESLQKEIPQKFPEVDTFFSGVHLLEIVPKGVHKGTALKRLCDILHIPVANSVAAGDEENDLTMLRAAGVGCAMANAVPTVKASANYVTQRTNDEDGVAEIVEKFLMQE